MLHATLLGVSKVAREQVGQHLIITLDAFLLEEQNTLFVEKAKKLRWPANTLGEQASVLRKKEKHEKQANLLGEKPKLLGVQGLTSLIRSS